MQSESDYTSHSPNLFSLRAFTMLIITLMGTSACGTIIYGFQESVWVTSDPMGETVVVNDKPVVTPSFLLLPRTEDIHASAEKEGCTKAELQIHRRLNTWTILVGNLPLLVALPAGVLIDFVTGGAWSFEKDHIHLALSCGGKG
jgi:hypothetical protein